MKDRVAEPELVRLRVPWPAAARRRTGARTLDHDKAALVALVSLGICAAAVLLWMGRDLSFYYDDWNFILDRRGMTADTLLAPHNEHLLVGLVLVYKALLQVFGLDGFGAWRVLAVLVNLASLVLLFLVVRRAVAGWTALLLVAPLLLMGHAHHALLIPFQMTFSGTMAAGLGALLALDADSRRGDLLAGALLTVALAFGGLGLSFVVAAALEIALRRRPGQGLRRLWVVAIPAALYLAWWLAYAPRDEDLRGPSLALTFAVDSASATIGAYTALGLDYGRVLLVVLVVATGWRIARLGAVPVRTVSLLAAVLTFWVLTGLVRDAFQESRYYLASAMLVVGAAAPLLPARRPSPAALTAGAVAAGAFVLMGLPQLRDGRDVFLTTILPSLARLKAVEVAADRVDPAFVADPGGAPGAGAGGYLAAVRDFHSSPALSIPAIRANAGLANAFDVALVGAERLGLVPAGTERAAGPAPAVERGASTPSGPHCVRVGASHVVLRLPPAGARIAAPAAVTVGLQRLGHGGAQGWSAHVPAGQTVDLRVAPDRLPDPWRATLDGPPGARVCGLA